MPRPVLQSAPVNNRTSLRATLAARGALSDLNFSTLFQPTVQPTEQGTVNLDQSNALGRVSLGAAVQAATDVPPVATMSYNRGDPFREHAGGLMCEAYCSTRNLSGLSAQQTASLQADTDPTPAHTTRYRRTRLTLREDRATITHSLHLVLLPLWAFRSTLLSYARAIVQWLPLHNGSQHLHLWIILHCACCLSRRDGTKLPVYTE